MNDVKAEVDAEVTCLLDLMSRANLDSSQIAVENGDDAEHINVIVAGNKSTFARAEPLIDRMNFALQNFVISWLAECDAGVTNAWVTRIGGPITGLDGQPIVNSDTDNVLEGRKGTYFTWADTSETWDLTKGQHQSAYNLAQTSHTRGFHDPLGLFALFLDWETGKIQCRLRGTWRAESVDDVSDWLQIRGVDSSKDCEDASNHNRLSLEGQVPVWNNATVAYRFHVSAI